MNEYYLWTAGELEEATRGAFKGVPQDKAAMFARGVSIDSRSAVYGDVFVALKGAYRDGHCFVHGAFENGATMAIVSKAPEGVEADDPRLIYVSDTYQALWDMATFARARSQATIIAVTGSSGKTSVKTALKNALNMTGKTHSSARSDNNRIGVPLSLARMPSHAEYGVFEIASVNPGDTALLAGLLQPHHALVVNVMAISMDHFDSIQQLCAEKAIIANFLPQGGRLIINGDCENAETLQRCLPENCMVERVSLNDTKAEYYPTEVIKHETCTCMSIELNGLWMMARVEAIGDHWISNALMILAMVKALNADLSQASMSLASMSSLVGRGRHYKVPVWRGKCTIIDESLNANPLTMRLAFQTLLSKKKASPKARRIVVLGSMLQLGLESRAAHKDLVRHINTLDIDRVYTLGADMNEAAEGLKEGLLFGSYDSIEALYKDLKVQAEEDDLIMIKGSQEMHMASLVTMIINNPFGRFKGDGLMDMHHRGFEAAE